MAKTPAKTSAKVASGVAPRDTEPPATSTPAAKPLKTVGRFSFALDKGLEIPAAAPRAPSAVELPFKEFFGEMEHNDHFFVPLSFWVSPKEEGGRGVAVEKAKVGYQRQKVRGAFNDWVKKDEEHRSHLDIVLVPRQAGDDNGRFPEAGLSVFLQDKRKL